MTDDTLVQRPDELAAPLDLLLVNSTRSFAGRMAPNVSWTRFGVNLAQQPRTVARRGVGLARELGTIAAGNSDRAPARPDKRFSDPAWRGNPLLRRSMQAYLAVSETADALFADAALDWRDAEKMRFVLDNIIEGLSPTNNPLLSPLGWKALIDTGGLSAVRGVRAFVRDMLSKPRIPAMVEPDAYAVGETVAATKGAVVLQTRMFELIHYIPQTPTVRAIPLLMVPPVINKYYIMDIAPGRSMIEYFLRQGQQVFAISWRNPQARHSDWGFDAYGQAIVDALDAVQKIAGTDSAHMLATCSGGILAAMTAAHLAETGEGDRIAGLTLAVTVLEQSKAGFASAMMSERAAKAAIRTSASRGYLDGRAMAEVFAWMRPTDLVWRYCGSPASPAPYGFPYLAWLLGRVLTKLDLGVVDILGLSWGGALAQQFAFQNPRRCRRLVLVASGSGVLMVPGRLHVLAKMVTPRRFRDPKYAASIAGDLYGGTARHDSDDVARIFGTQLHGGSKAGYLHQLLAGTVWTSLFALPAIRQPTLIVAGTDDPIIPVANAHIMSRLLPHAEMHLHPGGHIDLITNAGELAPVIDTFLQKPGERP